MKKVFIICAITTLLSSCISTKQFTKTTEKFLKDHHFEANVKPNHIKGTTKFHASIDSLYNTDKLKAIAPQADIIYKISDGKVIVEGEAKGVLDADKIAELYKNLIKTIQFWKR